MRSYLKMTDHGIKDRRLRADDYFMRLPALRAMNDGEVGKLSANNGTEEVRIMFKEIYYRN